MENSPNLVSGLCHFLGWSCISVMWLLSVKGGSNKEMLPPNHHWGINLAELKAHIVRKLGPEGSKQYFYYLQRFLSLKLSKGEFDKLCLNILGRENVPLHNQLIRSILRNACSAKAPPPVGYSGDVSKHGVQVGGKEASADGYQQDGSRISVSQTLGSAGLSNGVNILPVSPRKARTGLRDRKSGDRRSALGPNGKTGPDLPLSTAIQSNDLNVILENGNITRSDIWRPVHQHHEQELMQQVQNENESLVPHPSKMHVALRFPRFSEGSPYALSNDQNELLVRNDRNNSSAWNPVQAPLGVPLCPRSIGGARRALPSISSSKFVETCIDGALLGSFTLRDRMEHIALAQGLEGVSADCINILNHGLDSYIKRLVRSCVELVGTRSGQELTRNNANKHSNHLMLINGVKPGHQYQIQNTAAHLEMQELKAHRPISLQDFRVAMELNPRQLGEDWPLLLEKLCTHAFDE